MAVGLDGVAHERGDGRVIGAKQRMRTTSPVVERGLLADFQGTTYTRDQRPHVVVLVQVAEIDQRSRPGIAGRERPCPPARGPHVPDAEGRPPLGRWLPW